MPVSVFNVDDAGFGEGDSYTLFDETQHRNNMWWHLTTALFGDTGFKVFSRRWTFDIFDLNVPQGATVRRATFEKTAKTTGSNSDDPYRVSLLDPSPLHSNPVATEDGLHGGDANWLVKDATRNTPFVWSDWEPIGRVYDDSPADKDGTAIVAWGGQFNYLTDLGSGTFGAAWLASSTYTLGEVRLRIVRSNGIDNTDTPTTSRPGVNLRVEVYDVISATDRRPSGSPIATSETVSWDDLVPGVLPTSDPNTWPIFTFTGGPTITSGTNYVYKLIVDGGGVLPLGAPYIRTALDQGFDTVGDPTDAATNDAAGVFWGSGGFNQAAYPADAPHTPNPPENNDGGVLIADRVFQDDEIIVASNGSSWTIDVLHVWGHDIDSPGLGIDTELDGSFPSTTDLVQLMQDWIDDSGYDEVGTRTAIVMDPISTFGETLNEFAASDDPTDPGSVLRITYDNPQPGQATDPDPANLATDVLTDADLSWTTGAYAGTAAITHDAYFGTDPTPDAGEFQGNQPGNTFDPGPLSEGVTYFWRIDEVGPFGTTTGVVWSFTTCTRPTQATNPDPAHLAENVPTVAVLNWTPGTNPLGPITHDVYFGTDPTPDAGEFQGNQPGATFDPGLLAENTEYFWRIDEVNPCGTTTGVVWSFMTGVLGVAEGQGDVGLAVVGESTIEFAVLGESKVEIAVDGESEVGLAVDGASEIKIAVSGSATIERSEEE